MKLISLSISGYKRFLAKTTLKISGNMTVLVGPNEAGKTTLLKALRHLSHSDPIDDKEFYRYRRTKQARIESVYHLGPAEHAAIGSTVPKRFRLWKEEDGKLYSSIEPRIERPKSHRPAFLKAALKCANSAAFKSMLARRIDEIDIVDEDDEEQVQRLRGLKQGIEELSFDTDTIDDVELAAIEEFAEFLSEQSTETSPRYISEFCDKAKEFLGKERVEHPNEVARKRITSSRPLVLEFSPEARTLNTTYDMRWFSPEDAKRQEEPTIALLNLCTVAGLDLDELDLNCKDKRRDLIASQITNANMALKAVFDEHYSQDDVSIEFECSGSILSVMVGRVRNGRSSHNLVEERSEGFRQFAALLAFILKEEARKPILLIDEAELHLHYEPPRVYRRVFCLKLMQLFQEHSGLHRNPPLLHAA